MVGLSEIDPNSFSRPDECIVTSLSLDLDVDFVDRKLRGYVKMGVMKVEPSAKRLILDTSELHIKSVRNATDDSDLSFTIGDGVAAFGAPLVIELPQQSADKCNVIIDYETSPSASALQWLTAQQTCGKKHPYLFSQGQAIHSRSMLPCQDSPGVKMPYVATVRTPRELVALMSGLRKGSKVDANDTSKMIHQFEQPVPIPSYLIAIVVGNLVSSDIGPRSKVWSESEMIDAAAHEFAETEKMLSTAESILGPYVWGVYDLLVLPPSFPYGGMENPCLTFVTPTCIAGDRTLASVIAHEITHSWMGNLVTNSNWEHFWLNEGHTVFIERKIAGRMFGEQLRHFLALDGWTELRNQIGHIQEPYTHLVPQLKGVDPDDAFSLVPYEKGSNLLMYLEQKLGGADVFEPFLKAYVNEFKFKSITTDDWKQFLYKFFHDKQELLDQMEWNDWFHKPGMPPFKPHYDMTLSDACASLADSWTQCDDSKLMQFQPSDLDQFSAYQKKAFLGLLLQHPPLSSEKAAKMEELYHFNAATNSEIRFRWLRICIRARMESAVPLALRFVAEQGRMKFVRPLYRDLYEWERSRQDAQDNYAATQHQMHPVTAAMLAKDLHRV